MKRHERRNRDGLGRPGGKGSCTSDEQKEKKFCGRSRKRRKDRQAKHISYLGTVRKQDRRILERRLQKEFHPYATGERGSHVDGGSVLEKEGTIT